MVEEDVVGRVEVTGETGAEDVVDIGVLKGRILEEVEDVVAEVVEGRGVEGVVVAKAEAGVGEELDGWLTSVFEEELVDGVVEVVPEVVPEESELGESKFDGSIEVRGHEKSTSEAKERKEKESERERAKKNIASKRKQEIVL